jgi:aryl-alcohol dehydrogenase-like predicted oxidoreductase
MQNHYNLLYREEEREMMPTLKARRRANACVPFTYFGVTAFRRRLDPVVAARSRSTDAPVRFAVAAQRERPLDWDLQVRFVRGHRRPVSLCLCVFERPCSSACRRVEKIAKARGVSMAQIALAWLLSKDGAPRHVAYALPAMLSRFSGQWSLPLFAERRRSRSCKIWWALWI